MRHQAVVMHVVLTARYGLGTGCQFESTAAIIESTRALLVYLCLQQMLRRFATFQVATACLSCSPPPTPDLNLPKLIPLLYSKHK